MKRLSLLAFSCLLASTGCNGGKDGTSSSGSGGDSGGDDGGGFWAVGENGAMVRLSHGGDVSTYPLDEAGDLRAIACRGTEQAVAVGEGGLLVVTFDPQYDTVETLNAYARAHNADAPGWHFLTGPLPEITRLCEAFGIEFWPDEGLLSHTLQTAVLDRTGRFAGTIEGA